MDLVYNKTTGEWEIKKEPYAVIECETEEIYNKMVEGYKKLHPQKPDYEGDGYDENGKLIYDTAYCPNCRHMFEVDYDAVKHCPDCGQLIDWSDVG